MLERETSTVMKARVVVACGASLLMFCACNAGSEKETWKDILATEKKIYSQHDEEVIIRDFFQDRREGFFLDVGSARPKANSTSYYLEGHLGWTGIAIDALPEYAPQYARQRPRAKFFNYIVTDHAGTVDEFYRVKRAPGLSSTIKDRQWNGHTLRAQTIMVPTITLDRLLDREGIQKIDFLSMDIERGAPRALAGFDIERFAPELVCIEAGTGVDYQSGLLQYFSAHGYRRIDRYLKRDPFNWYFTQKD
jgi:FkbM family methyltransferase